MRGWFALLLLSLARGVSLAMTISATTLLTCPHIHSKVLLAQIEALTHAQLRAGLTPSVQPFHALVYPLPLRLIRQISVAYGTRCDLNVAGRLAEFKSVARPVIREPDARLRVGYVSSDFVNHPLAHLMQSAFGMHNRHKFEVFCFSLTANDGSTYYQKISSQVEHFVDVSSMHTIDIAKLINSFQIHVLFNLNGYTRVRATKFLRCSLRLFRCPTWDFVAQWVHHVCSTWSRTPWPAHSRSRASIPKSSCTCLIRTSSTITCKATLRCWR